ncbi:two-component system response regulator [Pseudomonas sp. 1D4]|uniref:response regulator n=1 Tax=Pseudomonas sp. 1D4 TaxID=1843691 RepID=UPI00084A497E|nr:response regulator [Pseudomonas sp. 1D4]OEC45255.1 two-component system response regulator [Pseudomonas sp. 1D4]
MLKPILLVEDNPHDLELTLVALERSQLANDGNPAVLLLDLKLPKVDGLEVLKVVRETPELRSIPTVMLTSSREEPDLQRAYELGVNAYVVKPVEFKEFVAAISDLGVFWAVLNEPPPGSLRLQRRPGS